MCIANLKKRPNNVRGLHIDAYGITHYVPDWDSSILKHAYSKNTNISNVVGFETFRSIVNNVTNKYYFVFKCCYPKLSDSRLFDLVIHEVHEELQTAIH